MWTLKHSLRTIFFAAFIISVSFFTNCRVEVVGEDDTSFTTPCTSSLGVLVNSKMQSTKIYTSSGGTCQEIKDPDTTKETEIDGDPACQKEVPFYTAGFETACFSLVTNNQNEVGDINNWGNNKKESSTETKWFYSQWAKLKIYAYPQYEKIRPVVKEVVYSTPSGSSGTCTLLVRIYKTSLSESSSDTKTAFVLHGGGWAQRGLMAEIQNDMIATIYANNGYTVFAPYYRLTKKSTETTAMANCYNATGKEIFEDMDAFYIWFKTNAGTYKTKTTNILAQGNSAGAHLAAYLAAQHPTEINHAVLFYGPLDMRFVLDEFRKPGGIYEFDTGGGVLFAAGFLGKSPLDLKTTPDLSSDLVVKSTFTNPVLQAKSFIVQGAGDTLVKPESALRLCEAMSGTPLSTSNYTFNSGDANKVCGTNNSKLYMIEGAGHVMDIEISCSTDGSKKLAEALGLPCADTSKNYATQIIGVYDDILASQ